MDSSQFSANQSHFESIERMESQGATCDTFRVKVYGKLQFLKRLKAEYAGDIRYQEALRKEFETGYRLEHPNLVRYISLTDDGILMEYVDGRNLSQLMASDPDYFRDKKHTDKFVRQLLGVLGYLHSHQVLHLDLKPDNILLTHINHDVKLVDLGFCYTDTFADTQGHTNDFAAPEQFPSSEEEGQGVEATVNVPTDLYAIGKILNLLPNHSIYNKVITRCTAERPEDRYQSVEEILYDINHQRRYYLWLAALVFVASFVFVGMTIFTHQQQETTSDIQEVVKDSVALKAQDSIVQAKDTLLSAPGKLQETVKDNQTQLKEDMDRMIDKAYHSTIACFCDSVFPSPSPTTGKAWADASTKFHKQTTQIADRLVKEYPNIPETTIRQEAESRFQSLVSSVFNQMREH